MIQENVTEQNTFVSSVDIFYPADWFNQIESAVISQYNILHPKGDVDNSVLSGFLLFDNNTQALSILSLATGTKLMSGDQREKTSSIGPVFLHDCHAEILAHRGFQVWVWNNLDMIFQNGELPPNLTIHFYSSTPPCGDCCVHQVNNTVLTQTGSKPFGCDQSQLSTTPPNVVRGKPGHGSRSQSVSCSDKLCIWVNCGAEGSLLSNFVKTIKISSICIGEGTLETINRAINERVNNKENKTKIFVGQSKWKQKDNSPSSSSFVWWKGCQKNGELIAAKYGRKLGVIPKRQEDPRFYSLICDAAMLNRFMERAENKENISLKNTKEKETEFSRRKNEIKKILIGYGGDWAKKFQQEREWILNM
ncbi:tRNA-specific adenosine deaminase 1 [Histomonas meleagridis]|uniref:tRNA-specific adenosine deaminase 1 n=1 Tax=Histomonas meleagridis TaxID=135588 RepID=UPI0035597BE4|nr:tRNA-specific adenosine deaminase 1 [Histomonas meleagridis]KAH0805057.1 tRNA-specific adenosine deaminase 1 [Histomonas meleagridis]